MSAQLIEAARAVVEAAYRMGSNVQLGNLMPKVSALSSALAAADAPTVAQPHRTADQMRGFTELEDAAGGVFAAGALAAQPAQEPCQHKRQKWAINMRTGSCSDCGATFVFGRDGNPDSWSAPSAAPVAAPPQPVPLTQEQAERIWLDGTEHGVMHKATAFRLIRATERAHGIGSKT